MKQSLLIILRKTRIVLLLSTLLLTVGCSKDTMSNESTPKNESYNTEINTQSSDEQSVSTEPEMSESTSDIAKSTVEMQLYSAFSENNITENDYDAIYLLCNEACHKWARHYNGYEESDFSEIVSSYALNAYLIQTSENWIFMGISSSNSAEYQINSVEYDEQFAFVNGVYVDTDRADGIFIFIIENIDGKLYINDMIYDTKDTFDNLYRRECVENPQPNFWTDSEKYTEILEKSVNLK